jgi:WhiB family transcriptional regulator, redox-sensing transcriptional regulator
MAALPDPLPRWELRACRGIDIEVFFPLDDKTVDVPVEASGYCDRCVMQTACLDWAMKHNERGIWGNTTEVQRKRLKRGVSRTFCIGCDAGDIIEMNGSEICLSCGLSWRV